MGRLVTGSGTGTGTGSGPARRIVFVAPNPSIDRLIEVDAITAGAIHRPDVVLALPGGKGLNAARAAFALGGRVTVVSIVAGRAGDWIEERLAAIGVEATVVRDEAGRETRTCLSVLDRSTGRLTEFYEPGEGIGPTAWASLEDAIVSELEAGDIGAVVCCGSLPIGAPTDGYARIVRMAQGRSVRTVVDGHGLPLLAALKAQPSVVKVNAAEAGEATGMSSAEPVELGRALVRGGAGQVIVTLGADGAVACERESAWRLSSPAPVGAYPVGSGDAFVGGLAVALVEGASLLDAARGGIAAGSANALVRGAGHLDAETAHRLVETVKVVPIRSEDGN
ncbi:MAG: hexose kinase [Candidatus Limnocylindrales bacterium]